jgi:hypothetical protein
MARGRSSAPFVAVGILAAGALVAYWLWPREGVAPGQGESRRASGPRGSWAPVGRSGESGGEEPGSIAGKVVSVRGIALPGAQVVARFVEDRPGGGRVHGADLDVAGAATAAEAGRYVLGPLEPGTYVVTATAAGHAAGARIGVQVRAGQKLEDIDLTLAEVGPRLSGKLIDAGGGPVPRGQVAVLPVDDDRLYRATADDEGTFQIMLPFGWYRVVGRAAGYAPVTVWVSLHQDASVELRLLAAARVEGRVVMQEDDRPVAGADVLLSSTDGAGGGESRTTTDDAGRFIVSDLAPGRYEARARKGALTGQFPGRVAVGLTEAVSGVEIRVARGRAISGRVVDAQGTPVPHATVQARPLADFGAVASHLRSLSGPNGTFALEGLMPGSYLVDARAAGTARAFREVAVGRTDVTGVDLVLLAGATVEGAVTRGGEPVPDATVSMWVKTGAYRSDHFETAQTGRDGVYRFERVSAGRLHLHAQHTSGAAQFGPDDLQPGQTRRVNLELAAGASVSGTVRAADGKPAPRARVTAHLAMMRGTLRGTTADEEGRFRLEHLVPGDLYLEAGLPGHGGGARWKPKPNHARLVLRDGERREGVELFVPLGDQALSGQVLDPADHPVEGAVVSAEREWRGHAVGGGYQKVLSGADGSFLIPDVSEDIYTVFASHPSYSTAAAKQVRAGARNVRLRFQAPAGLSGRVVSDDGKPVPHYRLRVVPAEQGDLDQRDRWLQGAGSSELVVHDPTGAFALRPIEAGRYDISVTTSQNLQGSLQGVTVREGRITDGLQIVARRAATLRGQTVEYGTNRPIPSALVRGLGAALDLQTTADQQGRFVLPGVPTGRMQTVRVTGYWETHVMETLEVTIPAEGGDIDLPAVKLHPGKLDWGSPDAGLTGLGPVTRDGRATVGGVRDGSPAQKAGVLVGDLILEVDGSSVVDAGSSTVGFFMRGRAGDPLTLVLQTLGQAPRTVTFVRSPMQ